MAKKALYIVLTHPNTFVSRSIRLLTGDTFTHASLALNESLRPMYSFGRRALFSPFAGFIKESADTGIYGQCASVPCLVLKLPVTGPQHKKAAALLRRFVCGPRRYHFNRLGLFTNFMGIPRNEKNAYFCSEFVYYILRKSGVCNFNTHQSLVRPQGLLRAGGMVYYRGDLKRYVPQNTLGGV